MLLLKLVIQDWKETTLYSTRVLISLIYYLHSQSNPNKIIIAVSDNLCCSAVYAHQRVFDMFA
jgi:hypothetical protein